MNEMDSIEESKRLPLNKLKDMNVGDLMLKMFLPTILSFLVKKLGPDETQKRLFNTGYRITKKFLKVWFPEGKDLKKVIKKFFKKFWDVNVKVEEIEEDGKGVLRIINKKCGFCDPDASIEGITYPCQTVTGYLKALLEGFSDKYPLPSFHFETTKSQGAGDDSCEYLIKFEV